MHTKHKDKQITYNQCLQFPVEGRVESKWWSLCCGSLKACGLSVRLYMFLFCECVRDSVCVCASGRTQPLPCLLCVAVRPPWMRLELQLQGGRKNPTAYGFGTTLYFHLWPDNSTYILESSLRVRRQTADAILQHPAWFRFTDQWSNTPRNHLHTQYLYWPIIKCLQKLQWSYFQS